MTSAYPAYPLETLGSVASTLAATLYQANNDRNIISEKLHQMRDIYTPYVGYCCNVNIYKWKIHYGKIEIFFWR
jgi:hypothetical protein